MSLPVTISEHSIVTARARSRELRRQSQDALRRAALLRARAARLRSVRGLHEIRAQVRLSAAREARAAAEQRTRDQAQAREDAELDAWYRERVNEMLHDGWTRAELADVGVTDALLRELGLQPPD